jgi:hypothetical protein
MYKIDVTLICRVCGRRKQKRVAAATTWRTDAKGVKEQYPEIDVEGITGDVMLGVCLQCKRQGYSDSLSQAQRKITEATAYIAKVSAYLKLKKVGVTFNAFNDPR